MKYILSDPLLVPYVCKQLGIDPTYNSQVLACLEDGEPIAGVIYEHYNTVSVCAHIWIAEGRTPCKDWYVAIFDLPFNHFKVKKIIGRVASENEQAVRLDTHFGFQLEARIVDYSPLGDLLIYTMTREQCRILNSPLWAKTAAKVAACK